MFHSHDLTQDIGIYIVCIISLGIILLILSSFYGFQFRKPSRRLRDPEEIVKAAFSYNLFFEVWEVFAKV